jgi:outer membrane protein assembly factor BamB
VTRSPLSSSRFLKRLLLVAAGAALTAGLAVAVGPSDPGWPQWRGPKRTGTAPDLAARMTWPDSLRPAWKANVGVGHSSPVVADGRVYLFAREGEDEVLQSFELATGKRVWRQAYAAPYTVNPAAFSHGPGPKATPTVSGGRVYTLGISGILSAFDAATGRVVWRKEFGKQFPSTSPLYGAAQSPLVDGGRVIVHVGGDGNGALTAFDVGTGAVAWAWKGDGPAFGSPVSAEIAGVRQIVTLTEKMVVGVAADSGRLLWSLPFTTEYTQNAVTPVVDGNIVYVSGLEHPVQALRMLAAKGGGWRSETAWENPDVSLYMSSPVLVDGRLYGFSHRRKGQLFCLDPATGKTIWLSDGRQGDNASLVAAGGAMLALTTEGELLVFETGGTSFKVLKRYAVADTPAWAHLAVVDGGVLVKDERSLAYLRF